MINTIPMPPPEPQPAELTPARAEQARIGAAIRSSNLGIFTRLVMWTAADIWATATDSGAPFSISIEEVAEQTSLPVREVSIEVALLMTFGWLIHNDAGEWMATVPGPRTAP